MKTDFHNKDFALSLALIWRLRWTWKWPIAEYPTTSDHTYYYFPQEAFFEEQERNYTIEVILIQWNENKLQGILQFGPTVLYISPDVTQVLGRVGIQEGWIEGNARYNVINLPKKGNWQNNSYILASYMITYRVRYTNFE